MKKIISLIAASAFAMVFAAACGDDKGKAEDACNKFKTEQECKEDGVGKDLKDKFICKFDKDKSEGKRCYAEEKKEGKKDE